MKSATLIFSLALLLFSSSGQAGAIDELKCYQLTENSCFDALNKQRLPDSVIQDWINHIFTKSSLSSVEASRVLEKIIAHPNTTPETVKFIDDNLKWARKNLKASRINQKKDISRLDGIIRFYGLSPKNQILSCELTYAYRKEGSVTLSNLFINGCKIAQYLRSGSDLVVVNSEKLDGCQNIMNYGAATKAGGTILSGEKAMQACEQRINSTHKTVALEADTLTQIHVNTQGRVAE